MGGLTVNELAALWHEQRWAEMGDGPGLASPGPGPATTSSERIDDGGLRSVE